jgi:hypothetical protein
MIGLWILVALMVGLAMGWLIGYCQRENDLIGQVRHRSLLGLASHPETAMREDEGWFGLEDVRRSHATGIDSTLLFPETPYNEADWPVYPEFPCALCGKDGHREAQCPDKRLKGVRPSHISELLVVHKMVTLTEAGNMLCGAPVTFGPGTFSTIIDDLVTCIDCRTLLQEENHE